jgi:hypothetical protein
VRWAQRLRPLRGDQGWLQDRPTIFYQQMSKLTRDVGTYSSEKNWHSSQNSKNKKQRNDLWAALRVCSEDVMNLLQLSISQRLLIFWKRRIRVRFNFKIEDMIAKCLGGAEGGKEEGGSEGLSGCQELDWEVFLCLCHCQHIALN